MVINFFGKRGSGKTTVIRGQIEDCRRPVIIIDVLGNFIDENYFQTTSLPHAIEGLENYVEDPDENPSIISLKTSNPTLAAEYFASSIWEIEGGTLICDEIDSIRITEGSCFDEYIRYGRNHDGDLLTGCRRPAELSKNITAAANKFYCFQTHEPRDIEYFRTIFGERAFELLKLPKYHGIFIDYDNEIEGTFYIDINGNIFHTNESSINDHPSIGEEE